MVEETGENHRPVVNFMTATNAVRECNTIFVGKKLCELDVVMQNSVAISLYVYSASVTLVSNNCNGKERVARPVFFFLSSIGV